MMGFGYFVIMIRVGRSGGRRRQKTQTNANMTLGLWFSLFALCFAFVVWVYVSGPLFLSQWTTPHHPQPTKTPEERKRRKSCLLTQSKWFHTSHKGGAVLRDTKDRRSSLRDHLHPNKPPPSHVCVVYVRVWHTPNRLFLLLPSSFV
jgi:hypothetical protein